MEEVENKTKNSNDGPIKKSKLRESNKKTLNATKKPVLDIRSSNINREDLSNKDNQNRKSMTPFTNRITFEYIYSKESKKVIVRKVDYENNLTYNNNEKENSQLKDVKSKKENKYIIEKNNDLSGKNKKDLKVIEEEPEYRKKGYDGSKAKENQLNDGKQKDNKNIIKNRNSVSMIGISNDNINITNKNDQLKEQNVSRLSEKNLSSTASQNMKFDRYEYIYSNNGKVTVRQINGRKSILSDEVIDNTKSQINEENNFRNKKEIKKFEGIGVKKKESEERKIKENKLFRAPQKDNTSLNYSPPRNNFKNNLIKNSNKPNLNELPMKKNLSFTPNNNNIKYEYIYSKDNKVIIKLVEEEEYLLKDNVKEQEMLDKEKNEKNKKEKIKEREKKEEIKKQRQSGEKIKEKKEIESKKDEEPLKDQRENEKNKYKENEMKKKKQCEVKNDNQKNGFREIYDKKNINNNIKAQDAGKIQQNKISNNFKVNNNNLQKNNPIYELNNISKESNAIKIFNDKLDNASISLISESSTQNVIKNMTNRLSNLIKNSKIPTYDLDDYTITKRIGKGSYGFIYMLEHKKQNKTFALKKIICNDLDYVGHYLREFDILNKNSHPNIMKIYGISGKVLDPTVITLYVLMEIAIYDWDKEIYKRLETKNYYKEEELISILKQLTSALSFLQLNKISHRDIKPQNILVFPHGKYKLADFGEAKKVNAINQYNTLRGTDIYMSPILYEGAKKDLDDVIHNSYKSDVFSLGLCFCYASALNFDIITKLRECKDDNKISFCLNKFLKNFYSKQYIDLLCVLLVYDELQRVDFIKLDNYLYDNFPDNDN